MYQRTVFDVLMSVEVRYRQLRGLELESKKCLNDLDRLDNCLQAMILCCYSVSAVLLLMLGSVDCF